MASYLAGLSSVMHEGTVLSTQLKLRPYIPTISKGLARSQAKTRYVPKKKGIDTRSICDSLVTRCTVDL
jgi:hypothetical protein